MFALMIRYKRDNYYINTYPHLKDVVKVIKEMMEEENIKEIIREFDWYVTEETMRKILNILALLKNCKEKTSYGENRAFYKPL